MLWEKVAYLATDEKRAAAFAALKKCVGTTPRAILDARPAILQEIAMQGGAVGVLERVRNMQDAAAYVMDAFDGDLDHVLDLPLPAARRALKKIGGIAEPGADRILVLMRSHQVLALESNGLRTLQRVGYGVTHKNYSTAYRSVIDAATPEIRPDADRLIDAHVLLRHHGQTTCKTSAPLCEACAARRLCDYARTRTA